MTAPSCPGNLDVTKRFAPYHGARYASKRPGGAPPLGVATRDEGQPLVIDERPPQLDAYRKKRDPDRTPEPFGGRRPGTGGALRRPAARRPAPALRRPPGDGRRAQELGGPQGAVGPARGQAPGRPRRGPPARVRRLRGRDPEGQLRGRRGHRVGPRAVPLGEARGPPGPARARARRGRALRPQAARPLDLRPDGRARRLGPAGDREGVAPHPEGRGARSSARKPRSAIPARSAPGSRSRRCATQAPCATRSARGSGPSHAPIHDVPAARARSSCSRPWPTGLRRAGTGSTRSSTTACACWRSAGATR